MGDLLLPLVNQVVRLLSKPNAVATEEIMRKGHRIFWCLSLERYRHRLSMEGEPLYYFAIAGRKNADVPSE